MNADELAPGERRMRAVTFAAYWLASGLLDASFLVLLLTGAFPRLDRDPLRAGLFIAAFSLTGAVLAAVAVVAAITGPGTVPSWRPGGTGSSTRHLGR